MSRSEGFATVCLEAMASGLAVISSKVGGFSDVIKEGENGYLVNQEDYKALSKRMIELANNHDKIRMFADSARNTIEKEYTWDKIIAKYNNLYSNFYKSTT